jgi:cell division protein ZapA
MGTDSVRVTIFGKEYSIRGDADAEMTKQVAQYVNSKIAELQNATASRDDIKIAVLSALNIAGELFEAKAKYEAELKKVQECQEKIRLLSDKIDISADK